MGNKGSVKQVRRAGIAVLLGLGGCYTGLSESADAADASGSDGGAEAGTDGASVGGSDSSGDTDGEFPGDASCRLDRSPLRRLTTTQYFNALDDLFPGHDFRALGVTFPTDVAVHGFENAALTQVPSPSLIEGYQRSALAVTTTIFEDEEEVVEILGQPLPGSRVEATAAVTDAIARHGQRVFRRPLTDGELQTYVQIFEDNFDETEAFDDDFIVGLSMAFQALLQAPGFVYIVEGGASADAEPGDLVALTSWEVASRLSFLLWDSMPDEALFAAAEADALSTPQEVEEQVRRMLEAPAARDVIRSFHRQWLEVDHVLEEMKDPGTYPQWSEQTANAALEQVERYAEHVFFEGEGTVAELFSGTQYPMHPSLSGVLDVGDVEDWTMMPVDGSQRRGLLTLPGVLATFAHPVHPSPVLRGAYVREQILCSPLPPPPEDVDVTPPDGSEGSALTNRERYETILDDDTCAGCHVLLHGFGFPFENYDSVGAFRELDDGIAVDPSAELLGVMGMEGTVEDALELADRIAEADVVRECVATQWYRYGFARDPDPEGGDVCMTDELMGAMVESGGDMRELLVTLATSEDFLHLRVPAQEGE